MANIRMPDGTVIRGVPDGVSKDDLNLHLIEKYGQEEFDKMTGSTKEALSPDVVDDEPQTEVPESGPPSSRASAYLHDIYKATGREPTREEADNAVRMRMEDEGIDPPESSTKLSDPYQSDKGNKSYAGQRVLATVGESGDRSVNLNPEQRQRSIALRASAEKTDGERLTIMRGAAEQALRTTGVTSSAAGGGILGLSPTMTPDERLQATAANINRMTELNIYGPERYGLTQDQIDAQMEDKVQTGIVSRKEQMAALEAQLAEMGAAQPSEDQIDALASQPLGGEGIPEEFRTWHNFYVAAVGSVDDQIATGYQITSSVKDRIKAQETSLGALYFKTIADNFEDLSDDAKGVIEAAGATYNMNVDEYIAFTAEQVDRATEQEQFYLDEYAQIITEVQAFKPKSADETWTGHMAAMALENVNQLGYIVAGAATGSPLLTISLFGTDIYARSYASARLKGRTASEAAQDAFVSALIEGATEAIPVGKFANLLRRGQKAKATEILSAIGTEFAQEVLAEGGQLLYDHNVIGEKTTWGEAFVQMRDAGVLGMMLGTTVAVPSIAASDIELSNAQERIDAAKKELGRLAIETQKNPEATNRTFTKEAKKEYVDAVRAKGEIVVAREKAELEKKKAKVEKKETKRKSKLSESEARQEKAAESAEKAPQGVTRKLTKEDIRIADTLEKAGAAELEQSDSEAVQELLEAGYLKVTAAGTPVVLPAGKRRLEAVRAAQAKTEQRAAAKAKKVQDVEAKLKVINEKRAQRAAKKKAVQESEQYTEQLEAQTEVSKVEAEVLTTLDTGPKKKYKGTKLGKVLRNAMDTIEKQEAKAKKALKGALWNKPTDGTTFDITGVLAKGTKDYANLVKVGALKLAKHGLNYSAWTADMIGEFGESIKPVLSRAWNDAKKAVSDIMKVSHAKFATGARKGTLKHAPKQYTKPGQIRRLRSVLMGLAKEGAEGRFWYEKSGKEILSIVGGDMGMARKMAGLLAVYSSGTAVAANTTNALKLWARFFGTDGKLTRSNAGTLAGRFGAQDALAIEWLNSKAEDEHFVESFGDKRFPFFQNLMREIDPKNYETGQGVTVDMWMMRAFGYEKDAPTDAEFAFVAVEINEIAKLLGWEKQQAQAAIWVAMKARWEYITKQSKDAAVKKGFAEWVVVGKGQPAFVVVGSTRDEQIENEKNIIRLFRKAALRASTGEIKAKLEQSKADFSDMLEKHYAVMSWEAEPSTKIGSRINNLSLEDKVMLQAEMAELFVNPETGREFIAEWLDLMGADQFVGPGAWEMNVGSTVQNSVLVPVKHKPGKTKTAQQEAAWAMDGYAAIMGFLMQQDAVAWHKPFYATTLKDANGVEILTRTLSHAKTLNFYEEIFKAAEARGIDGMEFAPIVLDGAVRVLNFTELNNREFHKLIVEAAEKAGVNGEMEVFQSDGNLIGNDWNIDKAGESYVNQISKNKNPSVQKAFERAKRQFAKRVAEIHAKYSSEESNARVRVTKLDKGTRLGRVPTGHIRFRHFGKEDTATLSVEKFGTGIKGAEYRGPGAVKVISLYPNKGFTKEVGLGQNEYVVDIPRTQMYDANADTMGLKERSREVTGFKMVDGKKVTTSTRHDNVKFETLVREAGFVGYYTPKAEGNMKGQGRVFQSLTVNNDSAVSTPTIKDDVAYSMVTKWRIWDTHDKVWVSAPYNNKKRARTRMDKLDNEYGGYRYQVREEVTAEPDIAYSVQSVPRVQVVENEYDEFEVREKNGEIYYTQDADDAIRTARSIHGADATIVIVDPEGDVITTDVAKKSTRVVIKNPDPSAVASISEFLDEWISTTTQNPLSPAERIVGSTAAVELRPFAGIMWIDSIRSFNKGEGGGSNALKLILELADLHGVTLVLTASPFEAGGNELEFNSLVQWYKRNGFAYGRQNKEDPAYTSGTMTREPRNPEIGTAFAMWKRPTTMTNAGLGTDKTRVQNYIGQFFGKFYGLMNFEVVEGFEELPDELFAQMHFFKSGATTQGVFHDDTTLGPTMYIIANNIVTLDAMMEVILHETIGHFGLRALLGSEYNKVMDLIRRDLPADVKQRGLKLGPGLNARRLAAEEVVAYIAGEFLNGRKLKGNQASLLKKVVTHIRLALAKMGWAKLNHNDITNLIMTSARFVKHTSQAKLQKRASIVTKMREAQYKIDKLTSAAHRQKTERGGLEIASSEKTGNYYVVNPDGSRDYFVNGKPYGRLMPMVSEKTIEASPGIQSWSKKGGKREWNVRLADGGQSIAKFSEYWEAKYGEKMQFEGDPNLALMADRRQGSIGLKQARKDDPALDRFMSKIGHGHGRRVAALRDWWAAKRQNWRESFEIEMLDQFAGIKHMEKSLGVLDIDSGYISVRLTAGSDVIIRSSIENGVPIWDENGTVGMDLDSKALMEILAPISQSAEMLQAFEAFIVARRARRLKKADKEKLLTREEIGAAFKFIRKKKLWKLFNSTAKELSEYKTKILDFATEAGLIDPVARKLWEHNDHVPFYRVLAENDKKGPFRHSRLGHIGKVVHRLKGGTDQLKNPLESIVQNLSMLIEASLKNKAMADVIENFDGTGVVTKAPQAEVTTALVPLKQIKDMLNDQGISIDAMAEDALEGIQKLTALQAPTAANVVSVQVEGKKQYYYIHDAGVLRGLDNVTPTQWTRLMSLLRFPKRVITTLITRMPDFILKNWFRDIWHTWMLSRHGTIIPVLSSARGWAKAIAQDATYKEVLSGGGMFDSGYVNASDPRKTNIAIRKGLLGKGRNGILDTPRKLAKFYMRIANGAENAHRIIVYEKTLKKTGSRKLALFEARDLMDFSVRGANPIVRFLTETVPFWGERVQGISRTGKGFTESPATMFLRSMPIVLATMALYAFNRDDERYKGLSDYDKSMYYHFFDVFEDGDHYRLPKPFEIGAIFSRIPEIITEVTLSNEPDKGKAAALALAWTVTEMLSLDPRDIQLLKPFMELHNNRVRFFDSPILSQWDLNLDPKDQYSYRTDPTIRAIAQAMPEIAPEWMRSPKQLEHLARGYLAGGIDYALAASQMLFEKQLNDGVARPTMRWDETPFAKSFKREEYAKSDIYLNNMYEVLEEANKIHNSINKLKKEVRTEGRDERIDYLREQNEALLYARGPMNDASKSVKKINDDIKAVYAHPRMSPDDKAERIEKLLRQRSLAAEKVYDYRPGGTRNKFTEQGYLEEVTDFLKGLIGKTKEEQVDELISARLPHTATLINDITISDEKLRSIV